MGGDQYLDKTTDGEAQEPQTPATEPKEPEPATPNPETAP